MFIARGCRSRPPQAGDRDREWRKVKFMNRNVESHFSMLPSAEISRSKFDRAQDVKFTFNVGDLIPFYVDEVLPGDTFDITTSKVVRMQTLLTPVMDNIYLDTYFFFVPNRLTWKHWRELMGENRESAWYPEVEYSVPQIKAYAKAPSATVNNGIVHTGDIFDYMGVPVGTVEEGVVSSDYEFSFNALPYRAVCMIFNDWFRDENLTDPINWSDGDADVLLSDLQYPGAGASNLSLPFKAAKYHDYFTSALPSAQKGPPVSVPAGFNVNIGPGWAVTTPTGPQSYYNTGSHLPLSFALSDGTIPNSHWLGTSAVKDTSDVDRSVLTTYTEVTSNRIWPNNLFAAPSSNQQTGLSILINDLRYAFQLQKLYERDARGGTRYIEIIRSHFGVDSPDARMQRPEYLGGNRIPISIHQITNQSQGENEFLGDLGAMSLTTDKHSDFVKSFTEHGFVIGLCVARYDHSYPQGLERFWSRKTRFDYYWPVFANLGEQAILKKEIYLTGTESDDDVFGYQERWAEYRYKPNRVAGEMRPGIDNTLDSWHFADYYSSVPYLSDSWIREDKTNVDRTLAVTSQVANQLFADIYIQNETTRPMPLYSIPGLVDHH